MYINRIDNVRNRNVQDSSKFGHAEFYNPIFNK